MFEKISAVFALLTVFPSGRGASLEDAASALYAFPLVGLVVGAISGGIGAAVLAAGLEPLLAATFAVASLALLTGMHHLDGLADTADAIMSRGTRERKNSILKDPGVGAAGAASIAIYLMVLVAAIYTAEPYKMIIVVICAEVISRLSIVVAMRAGDAAGGSSAALFVDAAKKWRNVAGAAIVGFFIIANVSGSLGYALGATATGVAIAFLVVRASVKSFGVVRGDALGAANEFSRLAAVVVLMAVL